MASTLKSKGKSGRPAPHGAEQMQVTARPKKTVEPPIWETVAALGAQISDEEWEKVPDDASLNYKHYLYGAPVTTR